MHLRTRFTLGLSLLAEEAPAIECARVSNFVEETICGDPSIMRLDTALNNNYRWTLNSDIGDSARKALKQSQRTWLHRRNRCADRECMATLYKQRIEEVCDYPVISGVHPICDIPEISETENQSN
ncbi:lysozyme inhibitor LprI family protein [Herbaspirillum sp.]|uniref:lysozyme inhibitor LprI family protein n=1 Tax=Herbaspirillum sp. TaxID=1890675 RepID=UPI0031E120F3